MKKVFYFFFRGLASRCHYTLIGKVNNYFTTETAFSLRLYYSNVGVRMKTETRCC